MLLEKSFIIEVFMKGVKEYYEDYGIYELCWFCVLLVFKYLVKGINIYVFFLYCLLKEMKLLKKKYWFLERRKLLFIYENSEKNGRDWGKINVDFKK